MNELKSSKKFAELRDMLVAYRNEMKKFEEDKKAHRKLMTPDEYWDWMDRTAEPEYPLTGGQTTALHLVANCEKDELEMTDFVWPKDVHDFIDTLRQMGAKSFVVTNRSTALMENIHGFVAEGCTMSGLCMVEPDSDWNPEPKPGIRFEL